MCHYLADIAARELVGEAIQEQPLVLACKLICCMNLHITPLTQCSLISTTDEHSRCLLTSITLNLHLSSLYSQLIRFCSKASEWPYKGVTERSWKVCNWLSIEQSEIKPSVIIVINCIFCSWNLWLWLVLWTLWPSLFY